MRMAVALAVAFMAGALPPQEARIHGRVTDSFGRPLANVRIALRPDLRGSVRTLLTVSTDREGRYEILKVVPGRYQIEPSIAGYVLIPISTSDRNITAGLAIELRANASPLVVDFRLSATSSLIVQVTDDRGDPMADVPVLLEGAVGIAQQTPNAGGPSVYRPAPRRGTTNDTGEVTLLEVTPGEYYLSADPNRGRTPLRIQSNQNPEAFVVTYYPAARSLPESPVVPIPPGQQLRATITLRTTRLARITGAAVSSNGAPVSNGLVSLTPRRDVPAHSGVAQNRQAQTLADGTFELASVYPADYLLTVSSVGRGAMGESASVSVSVAGEDITNVRLSTVPGAPAAEFVVRGFDQPRTVSPRTGASIRGRVLVAGSGQPLRRAIVSLGTSSNGFSNPVSVATDEEGRYEFARLSAGGYRVKAQKSGFATQAFGESEIQREPEVIVLNTSDQRDDVEISLSMGSAVIVTVLSDGAPVRGARVQLSRKGEAQELITVGDSRRTDDRGELRIGSLPAGSYYVGAAHEVANTYSPMIYFPGVDLFTEAAAIALGAGQETSVSVILPALPSK
jgi:hypothetical protein